MGIEFNFPFSLGTIKIIVYDHTVEIRYYNLFNEEQRNNYLPFGIYRINDHMIPQFYDNSHEVTFEDLQNNTTSSIPDYLITIVFSDTYKIHKRNINEMAQFTFSIYNGLIETMYFDEQRMLNDPNNGKHALTRIPQFPSTLHDLLNDRYALVKGHFKNGNLISGIGKMGDQFYKLEKDRDKIYPTFETLCDKPFRLVLVDENDDII